MKKIDGIVPGAAAHDEFGKHCAALLRRAFELGSLQEALEEELAHPTWDDADWCRMIVARASGLTPMFQDDDTVMFRCHKCKDTGHIVTDFIHANGQRCTQSRKCSPCKYLDWSKQEWEAKQEHEGRRRRKAVGQILSSWLMAL